MDVLTDKACDENPNYEDEESAAEVLFFPPLYIQRYSLALNFLTQYNIQSVIDFGCSDCGFFKLLPTVSSLEQIALVDVNRNLLISRKRSIIPEPRHFIHRRSKPLHVKLWAGSAEDVDSRLQGYEAVTLIEVIEHLYPEVLENVTKNVFGTIQPKLCIVTTPNSEFNILFENSDPQQFRHWDHKFEWSREEFQKWCEKVCQTFGYSVEYSGVGKMPSKPDSTHLGPCSQAAIFMFCRDENSQERPLPNVEWKEHYELIAESDFPYVKDVISNEEKIDIEVSYCLRQIAQALWSEAATDEPVQVPISRLASFHSIKLLCSEDGVRESLHRNSYKLTPDELFVIIDVDEMSSDSDLDSIMEGDSENDRLDSETCVTTHKICDTCERDTDVCRTEPVPNSTEHSDVLEEEDWDLELR